jgi:uncharacterized protein (UPF0261 family)
MAERNYDDTREVELTMTIAQAEAAAEAIFQSSRMDLGTRELSEQARGVLLTAVESRLHRGPTLPGLRSAGAADTINVPKQLFLDLVWLQAFYADQLNCRDGGERRPVKLPEALAQILTDRERRARDDAGGEADAPRVALMLDADELGGVFSACRMVISSSAGEGPYLAGVRRVLERLRPYTLLGQKAGPQA